MSETKVVILNGPPLSGKDEGCKYLVRVFGGNHKEFKNALFKLTKAFFNIDDEMWQWFYTRVNKECPSESLIINGKSYSPRQALIHVSENVVKPLLGQDFFGNSLANDLEEGLNFVSDGGFPSEIQPLVDNVGASNVLILRLFREGCSFDGDSRNYINYDQVSKGVTIEDLYNNGSLEQYFDNLESKIKDWLR